MTSTPAIIGVLLVGAIVAARAVLGGARFSYAARPLQTANELEFFRRLRAAHPEGHVFPQVAMSALLEPQGSTPQKRLQAFRRISQKRVDWAVCDPLGRVICVVELDDATHNIKRDRERDALLRSAGIPTLRWDSRNRPNVAAIRTRIEQAVQKGTQP